MLKVIEREAAPAIVLTHSAIVLYVRRGTTEDRKQKVIAFWYRDHIREAAKPLIAKWERRLGVKMYRLFVQRMKTKWGSCNPKMRTIRLNTELAKKTPECLEYIVVHELVHLIEPTHNERFRGLMDKYMPLWRHHRDELNRAPVAHEDWDF